MNLPAFEVDLGPPQAVLLAHAHPGVNRKQKMRQKLRQALCDRFAQGGFLRIGEEPDPSAALGLPADPSCRVALDLLVIDTDAEDQRERRLPSVAATGGPFPLRGLVTEPRDNLVFPDRLPRAGTENGKELVDAKTELISCSPLRKSPFPYPGIRGQALPAGIG
jgi:hypothetical protein